MAEIGRNDPCHCGSGIKHKKCCLEKKNVPKQFAPPWRTYEEEWVLKEVLKESASFAAYFRSQRQKVKHQIKWSHDPSMPKGTPFACVRIGSGPKYICLRSVPPSPSDAVKIAHEIEHLVLDEEGFPNISTASTHREVGSALAAMLQDLIIDTRLITFGFDAKQKYLDELDDTMNQLKPINNPPTSRLGKILWTFNFASKILDCGLFIAETDEYRNFLSWFKTRFPEIALSGQELCYIVNEVGYDTPEKMQASFNQIIKKCRVGDILQVKA
ncbi:MAG TPA: SEC-C metal-binding domain-containing protein [Dongiaceae bacterium]|nr:SEC-C metal-binding domain-containing protein [Dongiaceae bacterium]